MVTPTYPRLARFRQVSRRCRYRCSRSSACDLKSRNNTNTRVLSSSQRPPKLFACSRRLASAWRRFCRAVTTSATPMLPLLTGSASVSQTDLIGKVSTSQPSVVSHEQRRQQRRSSRTPTRMAENVRGWRYTMGGGQAGFDYALRAAMAANLTGANVPEEILYPNTRVDDQGAPLSGANKYVLQFDKDKIP